MSEQDIRGRLAALAEEFETIAGYCDPDTHRPLASGRKAAKDAQTVRDALAEIERLERVGRMCGENADRRTAEVVKLRAERDALQRERDTLQGALRDEVDRWTGAEAARVEAERQLAEAQLENKKWRIAFDFEHKACEHHISEGKRLSAQLAEAQAARDEWKERATVYAQALIDIRDSSDVIVPSIAARAALASGAGEDIRG